MRGKMECIHGQSSCLRYALRKGRCRHEPEMGLRLTGCMIVDDAAPCLVESDAEKKQTLTIKASSLNEVRQILSRNSEEQSVFFLAFVKCRRNMLHISLGVGLGASSSFHFFFLAKDLDLGVKEK